VVRISTSIPACISGDADWLLNFSAIVVPHAAATIAIPIVISRAIASPPGPGQWTPSEKPITSRTAAGTSARKLAESTSPASRTGRGAGEASRRSNHPCSMSRARLTPVAAPVNPAPCIRLTGMRKLW
jgi:hypothetical protein